MVIDVDYGKLISDSFEYTKDGLFKNVATWVILIILTVLPAIPFLLAVLFMLPSLASGAMPDVPTLIGVFIIAFICALILGAFYMGYLLKILRGEVPLPPVSGYGRLFSDGIKYLVIEIVYFIPVLIILAVTAGAAIMKLLPLIPAMTAGPDFDTLMPILGVVITGVIVAIVVAFILGLFAIVGIVRFARTGKMGEAFNFGAILATIRRIGWGSYIFALIIMAVLVAIVQVVVGMIPFLGGILQLLISPFVSVFVARYITLVYDHAAETAGSSPGSIQ